MTLSQMVSRVQAILHDDSPSTPLPTKVDDACVPNEFQDILVATAAAKYMEAIHD
jgi:hypothetical protein